jgi:hypothetical protein
MDTMNISALSSSFLLGTPFMSFRSLKQKALFGLAIAGCLVTALPLAATAQSGPGLTLFGGVERKDELNYHLDFGGQSSGWDRYRLRIPANKMKLAVAQFAISYPDYYKGTFNPKEVEIRVKGKSVKLQEVKWNKENSLIEIIPVDPVPAGNKVEIVLSDVKNPSFGGMFYFNCQILSPGDVPLLRYLGTWVIGIN